MQKRIIGFDFVVGELNLSALGKRALKNVVNHPPDMCALKAELDNIDRVINAFEESSKNFTMLTQIIAEAKDINQLLGKEDGYDVVELFEIKNFAHICGEAAVTAQALRESFGMQGWEVKDVSKVINVLDPFGSRSRGFYISDDFSERLALIRRKKRGLTEEDLTLRNSLTAEEKEEEALIARKLSEEIQPNIMDLQFNMRVLGAIDFTVQKARLAAAWSAVKPHFSNEVYLEGVINPLYVIAAENENREFVPVTISLSEGTTVLSGANMGGKSMLLKTVALNVYLASLGFFVFADHAEVILFDDIFLVMSDLENAGGGLSSFGGEVEKLNEIVSVTVDSYCLILLDEIARGTNPDEGKLIAQGVAKYFNGKECVCLFATHYDGVSLYAKNHYRVVGLANAKMSKGVSLNDLMGYSLVKASPNDPIPKEALKVAKLLSMDEELYEEIINLRDFADE